MSNKLPGDAPAAGSQTLRTKDVARTISRTSWDDGNLRLHCPDTVATDH